MLLFVIITYFTLEANDYYHDNYWLNQQNVTCPITVVTAYFNVPSKKSDSTYKTYIRKFFRIKACIVVFTDEPSIFAPYYSSGLRIQTIDLKETAHQILLWNDEYWNYQYKMDPEKNMHQGFKLYWIWALKTYFVQTSVDINPFMSQYYMWLDIGIFRSSNYYDLDISRVYPPQPFKLNSVYYGQPHSFYADDLKLNEAGKCMTDFRFKDRLAGGLFIVHRSFAHAWNSKYLAMMNEYRARDWFAGKDQSLLATMCIEQPLDCMIVRASWTPGDPWYIVLYYLLQQIPIVRVYHLRPKTKPQNNT